MQLRRGREFYGRKYEEAIALHREGRSVSSIAKHLGISYSAAYHWVRGLRKPEAGSVNEFLEFLKKNGPSAAAHLMEKFPKHNELFHMAARRGMPVKRIYLGKKYRELATWYCLGGQESVLEQRVGALMKKIAAAKGELKSLMLK